MQCLPRKRNRPSAAVRGIANERMTERGEMDAYLVRATGFEPAAQQRRVAETLEDREVRARRLPRGALSPSSCVGSDAGRSARRPCCLARGRPRPARDIHGPPFLPAARARVRYAPPGSSRRRGGRSCPCPADGRCRRAARARAAAHDAAARSAACRPNCRRPGGRRVPPACPRRATRHPRQRSKGRSLQAETPFPAAAIPDRPPPARRRAPAASAPPDDRPASRVRRRSTPGGERAKIAAMRAPAPRRSAGRRHRPAASAHGLPRPTAAPA